MTPHLSASVSRIKLAEIGDQCPCGCVGARRTRCAKGIGQGARLALTGFDQHQLRISVRRRRSLLGARRHRRDEMYEMLDHLSCELGVITEVGGEQRYIDDDIAVEKTSRKLGVEQPAGAGFACFPREIVDDS